MGSPQLNAISTSIIPKERDFVPQRLRTESYWALAAVFAAVYFGSLFSPALLDDADSTHAEAAREMFVSGDYVTLHVNGVRYLEKAPLPYWLVAFCYRIFGVNEFAARLPMALSVLLLGVLGVFWGRRAFGERAGIYAGLFVYTSAGMFLFTRILIPDVLLSLLIAASLYFFLTGLAPDGRAWPYQQIQRPNRNELGGLLLRVAAEFPESKIQDAFKYFQPEDFSRNTERLYLKMAPLPAAK